MIRKLLVGAAMSAAMLVAAQANALSFNLISTGAGTDPGSQGRRGFEIAANYWSSVITTNATVNLEIGFESYGPSGSNILGSTGSSSTLMYAADFESQIQATKSNSGVDQLASANMPTLSVNGGVSMIKPGYVDETNKLGIDTTKHIFDNDDSVDNTVIYATSANAKALGFSNAYLAANTYWTDAPGVDAQISFNSDFDFDFDPTDGTDPDQINFLVVAIHEIGHALGFVSGVDGYDYFGAPSGGNPSVYMTFSPNEDWFGSTLDMFRYSTNPGDLNGGGNQLDWSITNPNTDPLYTDYTVNPFFSIDGGDSALFDNYMSRGQYNGASYQASHWRIAGANNGVGNPTQDFLGIMDPVGHDYSSVTALDLAAFDAIGWNMSIDALEHPEYYATTSEIYLAADAPEPATWGMMLAGFGAIGAVARRRRTAVAA